MGFEKFASDQNNQPSGFARFATPKLIEKQYDKNIEQAGETRNRRKIVDGVDPALANVDPTLYEDSDFDQFVNQANPEFVAEHPTLAKILAAPGYAMQEVADLFPQGVQDWANRIGETGGEVMTMTENPNKATTGNWLGDKSADLLGFGAGLIANPGGATSLGGGAMKAADYALLPASAKLAGLAKKGVLGKGATRAIHGATAGTAYGGLEGIGNNEDLGGIAKTAGKEALTFGLAEPLLGGAGDVIGKGIKAVRGKLGKGATKVDDAVESTTNEIDDPFAGTTQELDLPPSILEQMQSEYKGLNLPKTQAEKALPNDNLLLNQMRNTFDGVSNASKGKVPKQPVIRRPVDMSTLPDQYPLPDVSNLEGKALVNRVKQEPLVLSGDTPLALPEGKTVNWQYGTGEVNPEYQLEQLAKQQKEAVATEQGEGLGKGARRNIVAQPSPDPAYLKEIEGKYNQLINDEVARMKDELGGVVKYMPDEQNGPLLRASLNAKWYKDFWQKNGRSPREGEYRNMAIKNLIEGVDSELSGPIPASDEFKQILSELSRGSKLPDEWHGLQKTINEVAATDTAGQGEGLKSLADDMLAEQKRIEPYGLTKNLDRLTEIENNARKRMQDYMDYRKQYPDAVGIVNRDIDFIKDACIVGATKLAKTGIKWSIWSREMLAEYGTTIEKNLPYIWQRSQELFSNGETVMKVQGKEFPVTLSDAATSPVLGKGATTPAITSELGKGALPEPTSKIIIGKQTEPFSFKDALKKFYTRVVNDQQPIWDTDAKTGKIASNAKNVSGIVDYNLLKGLVDKEGKQVGESLQKTVELIPKGKEEDFWTYMSQRHNIDRAREGKNVQANYTPEMSAEAVKIAEQEHPEYKAIGDGIVKWLDDFMQVWGVDTGIVNKDIYESLREMYPSYFPTQREFSELEKSIPDGISQKFTDQQTPIRKAKGSERDIKDPLENIMNLVNRTVRAAKYNEVGQSLLDTVRANPEKMKAFAEEIPVKEGMFANTDNIVSVLVDGKSVYLKINDKPLLDAMNGLPKSINNIPYVSALTQGVKNLITQKNPFFALRNITRDVPTAYVYGSEKNPLKFGADLVSAGKDMLTNGENYQRYQAVGGGGANFFKSSEAPQAAAELLGKGATLKNVVTHPLKTLGESAPIKAIEKFNNLTETAPRLAEFNRVFDKTGDVTEALHAANDVTVNFSRGGNVTKTVDKAGGMYVNAGVQGLDKFFRGFKDPKTALATIVKSGVAITAPDLALYMINKDNPEYQALDNRTKDTYFLIPNFLGKRDAKGNVATFTKIPKSRELGVLFGSLFERALRQAEGQDEAFKGFGNAVATNFAPANPLESNIITPALINIPRNKDFADRPIVPQSMIMDKRSPYLQYDDKTTNIAKAIGEYSSKVIPGGLSPKQIDYLIKSYTGVIGQFGIPLDVPGGNPVKALETQFTSDPLFSNQVTTDFYDKLDKLSASATDKNITEQIPSVKLTPEENMRNSMQGVSSALTRGTKEIGKIQASNDADKDAKIEAIKTQMLDLANKAVLANDPKTMQQIENVAKKKFLIKK